MLHYIFEMWLLHMTQACILSAIWFILTLSHNVSSKTGLCWIIVMTMSVLQCRGILEIKKEFFTQLQKQAIKELNNHLFELFRSWLEAIFSFLSSFTSIYPCLFSIITLLLGLLQFQDSKFQKVILVTRWLSKWPLQLGFGLRHIR